MLIRRWLYLITLLLGITPSLCAQQASQPGQVFSNIGGLLIASNFNEWSIQAGTTPTNSQIQWTNNKMCQPTSGGTTFQAFQIGSPITIVDANTANTETVTVTNFNSNTYGCQIQAVMTHTHYSYRIQSATAGLQEAINAAAGLPYQVVVTPDWQRAGGQTSMITNAQGNTNVTILDQRSSIVVPYLWNGSNYVAQSAGAGTACGSGGQLQASSGVGGGFTCDTSITLNTTTHNIITPNFNGLNWPSSAPLVNGYCLTATTALVGSWANCGGSNPPGFTDTLSGNVTSSATSFTMTTTGENTYGPGYLFVDTEWIYYSGIAGNTVTVAPGGRGWFGSTAASHTSTTSVWGCANCNGLPPTTLPYSPIVGAEGAGTQVQGINNPFPYGYNSQVSLNVNSGSSSMLVDKAGAVHQFATSTYALLVRPYLSAYPLGNEFAAPVYIGPQSTAPIVDSSYVQQINFSQQRTAPFGVGGGLAGPVTTIQTPTVAAPYVYQAFAPGSTTYSYVCEGVDTDGNLVPGAASSTMAAATLTSLANNQIFCPQSAGVVSFKVYRTAGNPNIGYLGSATQPYGYIVDTGATLDGTSPTGSNGDVTRLCNNNQQYCLLSGTSTTPPLACSSSTAGWDYKNVSATATPSNYHCYSGATTWTPTGQVAIGIVTPSMITGGLDAFQVINAVGATLPTGSILDITALGSANYTVATQLTALNQSSKSITLVKTPGTIFTVNTSFATPTDSPASAAIPIGQGSAILDLGGQSSGTPDFVLGPSAKVWDFFSNGNFGGTQESLKIDGVNIAGNASATVSGAMLHLQGLFLGTRISNSSTWVCNAQCLEVDAGNGSPGSGSSDIVFDDDDFQDGSTSGTYPGSVVKIDAVSSAGGIGNIIFQGGAIQFNGPHNQLLIINGRGGAETGPVEFFGTDLETAAAVTSGANPNVDPVQLTDAPQVRFSTFRLTGVTNSTYQQNAIDISQTIGNNSFGVHVEHMEVLSAASFACLINNTVEGTCETGNATGHGDLTIPPYYFGGAVNPEIRQTNTTPPTGANCGGVANGSIWTNSAGTTLVTTRYTCVNGSWIGG